MEPEDSLSHSQVPATCPYPKWDQPSPRLPISPLSPLLRPGIPSGLFPTGLPTKTLYTPFLSPIRAKCPALTFFVHQERSRSVYECFGARTWSFSTDFHEKPPTSRKSVQCQPPRYIRDGRTDMTELRVAVSERTASDHSEMTYRLRPCADRSCRSAVGEPDRHVGPACSAQAHPIRHCGGSGSLWLWCSVRCPCAVEVARHRSLKTRPRCRLKNPRRETVLSRSTNIKPKCGARTLFLPTLFHWNGPWLRLQLLYLQNGCFYNVGPDSSVGTTTRYGLDGPGIESHCGRDFPHSSRPALGPNQPPIKWVPRLCWGGKAAGAWRWTPTPSSADVKERVELYLYSTSGPLWSVLGRNLPFPFHPFIIDSTQTAVKPIIACSM